MIPRFAAALLLVGLPAFAHRLDEYLQATIISVEKERLVVQMRLTPGVAVFPIVYAGIDTDSDGVISDAEAKVYALKVVRDLSLVVDGEPARLRIVSTKFPKIEEMREGRGEIQLELDASAPVGGFHRRVTFQNRHQSPISAYLVNCLIPRDPDIRVIAQNRNYEQSVYELDYAQGRASALAMWFGASWWVAAAVFLLVVRLVWLWRRVPPGIAHAK